jgi:hypothetical protein
MTVEQAAAREYEHAGGGNGQLISLEQAQDRKADRGQSDECHPDPNPELVRTG